MLEATSASPCVLAALALWAMAATHTRADFFSEFHDGDAIRAYMAELAVRGHGTLVTLGTSVEGRPIEAIQIGRGELGIVLDGGMHAREWLSVSTPLCIAERLATDPRAQPILEHVRFSIVPLVNPDGYHRTWTTDRHWRKNARGVDLNRNFPIGWGGAGSSDDPESPNYRGEHPFSEPETQALRTLFDRGLYAAHIDFHSFSQVIVYPWSHRRDDPPDRDAFAAIADRMQRAIAEAHGKRYKVRPGSELSVGAGGTVADWSYAEHGALAFLVELRPASRAEGGFEVPPDQIAPTCDESYAAVLALGDWLLQRR